MSDLEKAFNTLSAKLTAYDRLFSYAEGNQKLVYTAERLEEAFDKLKARFNQNWCEVVIGSVLDRLVLKGFDPANKTINDKLDALWERYGLGLDAYDLHRDALITGEGYIIAWREGDVTDVYRNDPRLCHLFYKADRPKIKDFAAKWFVSSDGHTHIVLYYEDRLEYYVCEKKNKPDNARAFVQEREPAENPFRVIPVFRFISPGELHNIITLQDAINKLMADMMVAAEYGAFKQRWVVSNADTEQLKNGPNLVWSLPAGDGSGQQTQVGEFSSTELKNYIDAIDDLANKAAVISRTPKHYLAAAGASISGDALLAMEAPLIKKVQQRQERFSATWQELAAFLLKLEGEEVDKTTLLPVWAPAQSDQPITDAQSIQYQVQAGIPLETVLRRKGWSKTEIAQMRSDMDEQKKRDTEMSKALLDKLRAEADAANAAGSTDPAATDPNNPADGASNGQQ